MIRRGCAAVLTIVAACAISSPSEASEPYDVYGCRLPDGSPAPVDGWTTMRDAAGIATAETCWNRDLADGSRAMSARFTSPVGKEVYGGWMFFAPSDTTISNLSVWRAARVSTNYGVGWWILGADLSAAEPGPGLEGCLNYQTNHCSELGSLVDATSPANRVEFSGLQVRELDARLLCAGLNPGLPCDTPAEFRLYRTRIALLDQVAPVIGDVTGNLDGTAPVHGSLALRFSARDLGGGIAKVGVLVDGVERSAEAADPLALSCRTPYTSRVPCPRSVDSSVAIDTASLPDGVHEFAVFATDVSGNRGTSKRFAVSTRNASFPNGSGATRDAQIGVSVTTTRGKTVRQPLRYGQRVELRGTLSAEDGSAIGGARVELNVKSTRPGAASQVLTLTTDTRGGFTYFVPPGPSRSIDVGYRAFSADPDYAARMSVKLAVRAGIRLTATPKTLRNRHRVRFRGRLLGGPQPQDASMILYALAARGRVPVTSLRADSRGRFSFSYRFRTVTERSRFRFEVQVESRPSYPYAAGRSNRVAVVVRP